MNWLPLNCIVCEAIQRYHSEQITLDDCQFTFSSQGGFHGFLSDINTFADRALLSSIERDRSRNSSGAYETRRRRSGQHPVASYLYIDKSMSTNVISRVTKRTYLVKF